MPFLILPIITYTYGSFAFLSRIMRVGVIDVFSQDYIRTARAKGLGEGKVVMKHALRNSLLPIITVFANIFPLAIGGSVIIETIFTIPGMGFEIYNSILNSDYPMIVAVFTIIGFLTMLGYLIADILYAVVDPRISYK
jgi:peptide/nickel transport system permease protein